MSFDPISFTIGTGLSLAGLLASFDGAVKGYFLIEGFFDKDKGSRDLALRYHIEHHKLRSWGDHFRVYDPERCLLINEPEHTKQLISEILARIAVLHEQARPYISRYDLLLKDPGATNLIPSGDETERFQPDSAFVALRSKIRMNKKQKNPIRWVIKDRQKFSDIISRLEKLNADLFAILTPRDSDSLIKSLSLYVLAAINDIESLKSLQTENIGRHNLLALSAKLKELQRSEGNGQPTVRISKPSLAKSSPSTDRALGFYHRPGVLYERVWVEWRYVGGEVSVSDRETLLKRIDALGAMLCTVTMPDLRIPPCLGIFDDEEFAVNPESTGQIRTGFVYSIPPQYDPMAKPITLRDIIIHNKEAPLLGDRFKLACTIATALSLLHASNWLHKSFRSDNILFFHTKQRPHPPYPSILEPYITGFEYSRPYETMSIGYRPTGKSELDYYYHPNVVYGFNKALDFYSLGVVLFEIAWWRPLNTKINPGLKKPMTLELCRDTLLGNVHQLGPTMGVIYRNVVRTCLECDLPGDDEDFAHAVLNNILNELKTCKA